MSKFNYLLTGLIGCVFLSNPVYAEKLNKHRLINHIDSYGNITLRNTDYTELPDDLVLKGNLNLANSKIKKITKGFSCKRQLKFGQYGY